MSFWSGVFCSWVNQTRFKNLPRKCKQKIFPLYATISKFNLSVTQSLKLFNTLVVQIALYTVFSLTSPPPPPALMKSKALRCGVYWRGCLKEWGGGCFFKSKRYYSHEISKFCSFLLLNDKKQLIIIMYSL